MKTRSQTIEVVFASVLVEVALELQQTRPFRRLLPSDSTEGTTIPHVFDILYYLIDINWTDAPFLTNRSCSPSVNLLNLISRSAWFIVTNKEAGGGRLRVPVSVAMGRWFRQVQ